MRSHEASAAGIGLVPEDRRIIPGLTVEENLVATARPGDWTLARKPWPAEMDQWSHSRHGPDGNAVSSDKLVQKAERIRWLAGPLVHASNIITAGGRIYYHGVIARDAFNGLLLWDRRLDPPPSRIDGSWHGVRGSVLPVASADRFYAVNEGALQAPDAATGGTFGGEYAEYLSDISAWGPTDDGRIKPDLVANGVEGGLTTDEYVQVFQPDWESAVEIISLAMSI